MWTATDVQFPAQQGTVAPLEDFIRRTLRWSVIFLVSKACMSQPLLTLSVIGKIYTDEVFLYGNDVYKNEVRNVLGVSRTDFPVCKYSPLFGHA